MATVLSILKSLGFVLQHIDLVEIFNVAMVFTNNRQSFVCLFTQLVDTIMYLIFSMKGCIIKYENNRYAETILTT